MRRRITKFDQAMLDIIGIVSTIFLIGAGVGALVVWAFFT